VADASPDLAKKVEAALLGQMSQIADQVCDGMLVTGAAVPLKNRDGLGGPSNVVGFIGHALFTWLLSTTWPLSTFPQCSDSVAIGGIAEMLAWRTLEPT
jgi:hypothetical protein